MFVRIVLGVITLVVIAVLVVLAWPQGFGLEHTIGVAQLIAFRPVLACAALVLVVLLLVGMLIARRAGGFAGALTVLLLLFAGGTAAVLATRGWVPGSGHAGTAAAPPQDAVTVLSWNTYGSTVPPERIAALALRLGADVVSLPETSAATATAVATLMAASGVPVTPITSSRAIDETGLSTTLLIATSLGSYVQNTSLGDTSRLPSIVASPVDGNGPTLAAVHPISPTPANMDDWTRDLDWVGALCATPNLIVAGDFNATLDHFTDPGSCSDAAATASTGAVGTWPSWVPALLGAPIDHVMSTGGWRAVSAEVIQTEDEAGSDHRPITATLARQ